MKYLILISILSLSLSCKQEESSQVSSSQLGSTQSAVAKDDFSDFEKKEKDESCGTEKDIEKELIEAQKKKEFKLGGTTDCTVE